MNSDAPLLWTRRDVLRAVAASTLLPAVGLAAPARRRVGIIGGGMAGVALAWLLDGERDVVLLEARDSIGGNVRGAEVHLDGQTFTVDLGAQYFHPGPYPLYTGLLSALGLYAPESGATDAHAFPASITLTADVAPALRFVSPLLPQRAWPLLASWNQPAVAAFARAFAEAKRREDMDGSWALTLGEWLPTLGLMRDQWEGMLLPWAASLFSGSIDQARGLSARAAMIFAARALPPNPLDPLAYYVLKPGLIEVLSRMIKQCSTVKVLTGARVSSVERKEHGFKLQCANGRTAVVDELVCALSGPPTSQLLTALSGTAPQRAALDKMDFHDARLVLHTD